MSDSVGFFCKSFSGDFEPLSLLLETFSKYNIDDLPMTLSLPKSDIKLFENRFGISTPNVALIADESYSTEDLVKYPGWLSQQICKLLSHRAVDYSHYIVLDSDCYFLRPPRISDIAPRNSRRYSAFGSNLRTVFNATKQLCEYIAGRQSDEKTFALEAPGPTRLDNFDAIYAEHLRTDGAKTGAIERSNVAFKIFGRSRWAYFQPGQIFSKELVERLVDYFYQHRISVGNAIELCPWEYNWYGEFAAAWHFHETDFRISSFMHFQSEDDLSLARAQGMTSASLAEKFLIIQMAARHIRELSL